MADRRAVDTLQTRVVAGVLGLGRSSTEGLVHTAVCQVGVKLVHQARQAAEGRAGHHLEAEGLQETHLQCEELLRLELRVARNELLDGHALLLYLGRQVDGREHQALGLFRGHRLAKVEALEEDGGRGEHTLREAAGEVLPTDVLELGFIKGAEKRLVLDREDCEEERAPHHAHIGLGGASGGRGLAVYLVTRREEKERSGRPERAAHVCIPWPMNLVQKRAFPLPAIPWTHEDGHQPSCGLIWRQARATKAWVHASLDARTLSLARAASRVVCRRRASESASNVQWSACVDLEKSTRDMMVRRYVPTRSRRSRTSRVGGAPSKEYRTREGPTVTAGTSGTTFHNLQQCCSFLCCNVVVTLYIGGTTWPSATDCSRSDRGLPVRVCLS